MLARARLVIATETEQGHAWAENRIKLLTGGDRISARYMREDFFTFMPRFKLLIVGNHKPALANVDDAMRRRFHVIPFQAQPANRDNNLTRKLLCEAPEISRWAIDGCLDRQRIGLAVPPVVSDETSSYFGSQDLIGQWIDEFCHVDPGNTAIVTPVRVLFTSFRSFADAANKNAGSLKAFAENLSCRGFAGRVSRIHRRQVRVRISVRLLANTQ